MRTLINIVRLMVALAVDVAVLVAGPRIVGLATLIVAGVVAMEHLHPFGMTHMQHTTVSCATTVTEIAPSAATVSMYVGNSSSTCVRLGGLTVTATTGMSIGIGCRDGNGYAFAFKNATCISTSGSPVVVDVAYEEN